MASEPKFISPEEELAQMSQAGRAVRVTGEEAVKASQIMSKNAEFMEKVVQMQLKNTTGRLTSEQWLDENEREWNHMDDMLRNRPWAKNRDKPMRYPFKAPSDAMRRHEGHWIGDDRTLAPDFTRFEAENDVLTHIRATPEYPPGRRVILFTPEFGSAKSYDEGAWDALQPHDDCDIWVCSWQGWSTYDDMLPQVCRKLLSFGDGTSTIWYGHSSGALIAYEMLKMFEKHATPNLPVALVVSGCPAPFLFSEDYRPAAKYPWLGKFRYMSDFDDLTEEQAKVLKDEFSVDFDKSPSFAQRKCILGDRRILKRYRHVHEAMDMKVVLPVLAFSHDGDSMVTEESMKAWEECSAPGFEFVNLATGADWDTNHAMGHGYAKKPVSAVFSKINEWTEKYKRCTELKELLKLPQCDIGPTDGDVPASVDWVTVGGGIAGVHSTVDAHEHGFNCLCIDKYDGLGGIWNYYANKYSRVNTSEVSYRIVTQEGPTSRPNEDHSPTHDIMRDIYTVAARAKGSYRCKKEVVKVNREADGTYAVHGKCVITGKPFTTKTKGICFAINRRIGKRRDVPYPLEDKFLGEIRYGYANEVVGLNFWGKRVIVVGAGAFAFENLRTSLEHGAKHCTILGRRAGTTCPKWIDIIAYLRPLDEHWNTNKIGNAISFEAWRKCYEDANLPTPECWDEGLLKPHNHTVSVSDMAFIGGAYGLVDLQVGEIKTFRKDGQGVLFKDGSQKEVDIVIKATGFYLNHDVPKITGCQKMYPFGLVQANMFYQAEPLLDGGQFGSAKGKVEDDTGELADSMVTFIRGAEKFKEMGLHNFFEQKANPFGSGYVGGMLTNTYFMTYLFENQEKQKTLVAVSGEPFIQVDKLWISAIGNGFAIIARRLVDAILKHY